MNQTLRLYQSGALLGPMYQYGRRLMPAPPTQLKNLRGFSMSKVEGAEAYPLHWPAGWPRNRYPKRARFDASFAVARDSLFKQIKMLGGTHIVLSSNIALRRDGLPLAGQRQPTDKGVAVYFLRRGRQMVFACDRWDKVEDNMRAVEKTIDAIRGIERWGASEMMERAFQAFEALPAPKSCWEVLGLFPGASREAVQQAYRDKARAAHPDAGGTDAAMAELNRARDEALRAQ